MTHPWEAKWTCGARLGKGGQGFTHDATSVSDPAVKGVLKYLKNNQDSQARGRMRREVANLQALASIGGAVPRVLDHNIDQFEDLKIELYVVMDLVSGPTLAEYVRTNTRLEIDIAINCVLSLCRTVRIAHTLPIVHRDLKPDNIIVRDGGTHDLIVVDYGLSFNRSDEPITQTDETFRNRFLDLPETNTPGGDRRDPRSDLSAVCGVLYFCLTGHVPGHLQDAHGKLPHMRDGFSLRDYHKDDRVPKLENFLTRGFAPIVANRYQRVEEIQEKLEELLRKKGPVDESDPIQVASALSGQLLARDRKTQLANLVPNAQALISYIQNEVNKYNQKLGQFQLANEGGGFQLTMQTPHGLDLVLLAPISIVLTAVHHPYQRRRRYAVASRGEQCVLLAGDYAANTAQPQEVAKLALTWHEIAWYEGKADSILNIVSQSLEDWLTRQLKELSQEILSIQQAGAD
jgi:serine/threonine protein kinase